MAVKKGSGSNGKKWGGVMLIGLGVIFLLNNFGFTDFNLGVLWPLFLIVPGIFVLFGHDRD